MTTPKTLRPDWFDWPQIITLTRAFASQQEHMRFVGGCVRDSLLARPVSDIDMATSLAPEQVMQVAKAAGIKIVPTGLKHGTVTAVMDKKNIEITTLRRDAACDGRHAEVEFTDDWQEDAARRDFTMNALYLSFDGQLFDYAGGIEDARAGRVRFIGDASERIKEDYLRILRFFRFFAYYGNVPADHAALAACKKHKDGIEKLSGERIQQEMLKLLKAENPLPALTLMQETGVLAMLMAAANLPRLRALLEVEQQVSVKAAPATRLAALLVESEIDAIARRWKLSGNMQDNLTDLHRNLKQIKANMPEAQKKRLLRQLKREAFEQLALFVWANDNKNSYADFLALAKNWQIPEFPVSGADLKALGFAEGKELGAKLEQLEQKWENSNYSLDKKALLKIVR